MASSTAGNQKKWWCIVKPTFNISGTNALSHRSASTEATLDRVGISCCKRIATVASCVGRVIV